MASKTIMIQEDTYNKLLRLKNKHESFNDLLNRLIDVKQDLSPYFGILTQKEADQLYEIIETTRKINDQQDLQRSSEGE